MARSFLTAINLNKNELQNAAVQNLGTAPSSPVKGQLYFNSTGGDNTLYWWDGSSWVPAKASGGAFPGYGTITASTTFGQAKADGSATTVARSDHVHGTPTHTAADHSTIPISALAAATAAINMGGFVINSVGTPVAGTDATNKTYVDNLLTGMSWKTPVRLVAISMVPLTGTPVIDTIQTVVGDRVLVTNQGNTGNGIYVVSAGAWNRATDADTGPELVNASVFVSEGAFYKDTAWVCTNDAPIVIGTTTPTFVQFAGSGSVIAGAGMTQVGNTLDVIAANGSITVGSDNIQVAYGGTAGNFGTAVTAARSDHTHTGTYTRKVTGQCTAGTSTAFDISGLNTNQNVDVTVYRSTTPFDEVDCDVEHTSSSTVTLRFATAVAAGDYNIVVVG